MQNEETPTESLKKVFIVYCESTEKISFENEEILISIGKGDSRVLEIPYIELASSSNIPEITEPENVFIIYSENEEIPKYEGDTLIIPTQNSSTKIMKVKSHFLIEKFKELMQ